jgi:molecular chaperone DnaJ
MFGQGRIIKEPCDSCRGMGRVRRSRALEVSVPAGIEKGRRLYCAGRVTGVNGGPSAM